MEKKRRQCLPKQGQSIQQYVLCRWSRSGITDRGCRSQRPVESHAAGQIRFIAARVEDALARVARDPWDAVVLDPPRQGCPPAVLSAVFERIRPARVVYVSCNPDALAEELPVILKTGYRVTRVQPVDMFPHTDHIETVMAFDARMTPQLLTRGVVIVSTVAAALVEAYLATPTPRRLWIALAGFVADAGRRLAPARRRAADLDGGAVPDAGDLPRLARRRGLQPRHASGSCRCSA